MQQFDHLLPGINGLLKTYKVLLLTGIVTFSINVLQAQQLQVPNPEQAIIDLKEGYLIVRMPTSKAKIDTLTARAARTTDPDAKLQLQKQLDDAIEERDTLMADYTKAFRELYTFSNSAYYLDYEGRDLNITPFYHMDGSLMSKEEINQKPVFYLFFDRAEDGNTDLLIIRNMEGKEIPPPFPNRFSRSGINFLFLKVSERTFADWRVEKMNKRLQKYWKQVL
jgi:hypothetical protein